MQTVLLVIHLLIALTLVGVILMQRSEGGALGGLGGGLGGGAGAGSFGGLFTARGGANFLTRTTAILAVCFLSTSMLLAIIAGFDRDPGSVLDRVPIAPVEPAPPASPQAPIAN